MKPPGTTHSFLTDTSLFPTSITEEVSKPVSTPFICPILLSDHAPVVCLIYIKGIPQKATRLCFNDLLLLNKGFETQIRGKLVEFIEISKGDCENPQILGW